ncbi:MAG: TRAP transporter small permease [Sedimenticola sp.]
MKRLTRLLTIIEDGLLVILLTAMILLAGAQIFLRNFFDAGFIWADPSLRIMVLWVGLLGAMVATRNSRHISIDVISHYLMDGHKAWINRLTDGFAAIVCLLVSWHGVRFVLFEMEEGAILFLNIPAWLCELIIPIGFVVMGLRFLLHSLQGRPEKEPLS